MDIPDMISGISFLIILILAVFAYLVTDNSITLLIGFVALLGLVNELVN